MTTINFRHGLLIRSGPRLVNGGKWDAMLDDTMRNSVTNAELTIYISVYFQKIDPPSGKAGVYPDSDDAKKKIQKWAPGEFERFKSRLLREAQNFWSGHFWLKTPTHYDGLDWPEPNVTPNATHRCNLYCKLELTDATKRADAHYTIAVVRAQDGETFRSHSRLYSQHDLNSEQLIPHSTTKFWTHFHEVGHLIGLGHVGYAGHRNLHNDNDDKAYGVTQHDLQDVMGKGAVRREWHALPWQEAAATLTETKKDDWTVHMAHHGHHLLPKPLLPSDRR